jgi:hypothetical protein
VACRDDVKTQWTLARAIWHYLSGRRTARRSAHAKLYQNPLPLPSRRASLERGIFPILPRLFADRVASAADNRRFREIYESRRALPRR